MKAGIAFFVAAVIICSCTKRPPHRTSVNVDTLATVYAELLVLNERYNLDRDSLSAQRYQQEYRDVLDRHKYTKEEFESEIESVAASPDEFRILCDRALAKFQQIRTHPPKIGITTNS